MLTALGVQPTPRAAAAKLPRLTIVAKGREHRDIHKRFSLLD
jgi:hypothetical protein